MLLGLQLPSELQTSATSASETNAYALGWGEGRRLPHRQLSHGWLLRTESGEKISKSSAKASTVQLSALDSLEAASSTGKTTGAEGAAEEERLLGSAFSSDSQAATRLLRRFGCDGVSRATEETAALSSAAARERLSVSLWGCVSAQMRFGLLFCKAPERDLRLDAGDASAVESATRLLLQRVANFSLRVLSLVQQRFDGRLPLPPASFLFALRRHLHSQASLLQMFKIQPSTAQTPQQVGREAAHRARLLERMNQALWKNVSFSEKSSWQESEAQAKSAEDRLTTAVSVLASPIRSLSRGVQTLHEAVAKSLEAEEQTCTALSDLLSAEGNGAALCAPTETRPLRRVQTAEGESMPSASLASTANSSFLTLNVWRLLRASFYVPVLLRVHAKNLELHNYLNLALSIAGAGQRLLDLAVGVCLATSG